MSPCPQLYRRICPPPPQQEKMKSHVKNSAFCICWRLYMYLDKFTVPHMSFSGTVGWNYKKSYLSSNPWDIKYHSAFRGHAQKKSVRVTEIPWGLATLYLHRRSRVKVTFDKGPTVGLIFLWSHAVPTIHSIGRGALSETWRGGAHPHVRLSPLGMTDT